jgi:hypothetical protein
MLLLVLVLMSLLSAVSAQPKEGNDAIGASYGFIGPEADLDDRTVEYGASWAHWWRDNLTTEVDVTRPRQSGGDYSASIAGAYHLGPLFLLGGAGYQENTEGFDIHAGAGLNFWGGPVNLNFEGRAVIDPSGDGDLSHRTDYRAAGKIRFRF